MDITMIGLQNAGKTSLLRVLAVSVSSYGNYRSDHDSAKHALTRLSGRRVHCRVRQHEPLVARGGGGVASLFRLCCFAQPWAPSWVVQALTQTAAPFRLWAST
jgi:hypothetical protein